MVNEERLRRIEELRQELKDLQEQEDPGSIGEQEVKPKVEAPNITSPQAWRGRQGAELKLPSGNVCLVRNPGMKAFLKSGVIPDPLVGLVRQAISGDTEFDPKQFLQTDEDLEMLFDTLNNVLVEVVMQPKVLPPPEDSEGKIIPLDARDQSKLYADEVDMDDKVFIFQFAVGGTKDLEKFRQEQTAMLDRVQPS